MSGKSKGFILIQRVLVLTVYFFSGFILYSNKGILPSFLINFSIIIYPLSIFWTLYFFSGFILYSNKWTLNSFLINFSRIIYPLSIFWLQIRIKKRSKFLTIDSKMTTSELWFNLLPVVASLCTVIFSLTNTFLYIFEKIINSWLE